MISKRKGIFILFIIILSLIVGFCFYPHLPDKIATHWNEKNEVDGYSGKLFGILVFPIAMLIVALFFMVLPRIDPLKKNYDKFQKYYEGLVLAMMLFLFAIHLWVLLWNVGIKLNFFIPASTGFLIFFIGYILENVKKNWFVGIRTPWTLSNENVWNRTHKLGGKLFRIAGLITVCCAFFIENELYVIIIPVLIASLISVVYSYIEYSKEMKLINNK